MKQLLHALKLTGMLVLPLMSGCSSESKTTGFWEEMQKEAPINTGPQRTGEQVYHYRCEACHGKNTQGAPMPGDQYEWGIRAQKGMDVLMDHSLNGFKQTMPPRGGCLDCSDEELHSALMYMLNQDEIHFLDNTKP
ncbi:MAG: c-type cytochrome [Methylovulum sp.]|nr:c-type cytochrome [Methylovulum sp.]